MNRKTATLLALTALGLDLRRPQVQRCDPQIVYVNGKLHSVVCARCKRNLTLDDIGNGYPVCPGKPKEETP